MWRFDTIRSKHRRSKRRKKTALGSVSLRNRTGGSFAVLARSDDSVQQDVIDFLTRQIPKGVWRHDRQDGNGDAHLKVGLVGPAETVPLIDGALGLST